MLPDFDGKEPLIQYSPEELKKSPSNVYGIAKRVGLKLEQLRNIRNIITKPVNAPYTKEIKPKHVYQKALECLEKVNVLRVKAGLSETAVNKYPMRKITPSEVYYISIRLDDEIDLIARATSGKAITVNHDSIHTMREKTPADVYYVMRQNSYLIDTLIGKDGYNHVDVYLRTLEIIAEFEILKRELSSGTVVNEPEPVTGKMPTDIMTVAHDIHSLIKDAQKWAGMKVIAEVAEIDDEDITFISLYNEAGIILTEIIALKVYMNITDEVLLEEEIEDEVTPDNVYRKMSYAHRLIKSIVKGPNQDHE
ncbi:MAG: hypothetical protein GY941_25115 [Planctomycetes bacterium]|nr:hypothetical protein [Planctomycetota bacterium]